MIQARPGALGCVAVLVWRSVGNDGGAVAEAPERVQQRSPAGQTGGRHAREECFEAAGYLHPRFLADLMVASPSPRKIRSPNPWKHRGEDCESAGKRFTGTLYSILTIMIGCHNHKNHLVVTKKVPPLTVA